LKDGISQAKGFQTEEAKIYTNQHCFQPVKMTPCHKFLGNSICFKKEKRKRKKTVREPFEFGGLFKTCASGTNPKYK